MWFNSNERSSKNLKLVIDRKLALKKFSSDAVFVKLYSNLILSCENGLVSSLIVNP